MKVTFSAPGKITLFGEHAVVYGRPALVSAIDRRLYVTAEKRGDSSIKISAMDLHVPGLVLTFKEGSDDLLVETDHNQLIDAMGYVRKAIALTAKHLRKKCGVNITIKSDMPVGAGLGTSAAIAVSTIAAYGRLLGFDLKDEEIARIGHATELEVQGAASPMDTAISTYGGTLYIKPRKARPLIEKIGIGCKLSSVVGYTEREAKTGELLRKVRLLRDKNPAVVDSIMDTIAVIVEHAKTSLAGGDLESLGLLMNINHGQLESLGVSTKKLNDMVYSARSAGALGAKMTGAGGGGCIVALCPGRSDRVMVALSVVGGTPFEVSLSGPGVRLESVEG